MTDKNKICCPKCGAYMKVVPDESTETTEPESDLSEENGMGGLGGDPKVAAAKRGIDERLQSYRK